MPKEKTGDGFDYRTYMNEYVKEKLIYKRVHFTKSNPDDMELLAWLESQPEKAATYIKRLIRADMRARKQPE